MDNTQKKYKALEVVEISTGKVVHIVQLGDGLGVSERRMERTMSGMLNNLNCDEYFVREVAL